MKNWLKNLIFIFGIVLSFLLCDAVKANYINSINMDVYIDNDGNATVTEVWNTNLNEGTEGYRPYTKLENASISNFSIIDEMGNVYENLQYWDSNMSFEEKAYKSSIHRTTNGVELCWGISGYGNRTYTLKYDISNFVTQYTDTQGIYFNLLNLDQHVGSAKITIRSDKSLSLDTARIWSFGNNGSINFENGNIVLDSGGSLSSGQYMSALVRFESNLFNTTNTSINSFDDIYDEAFSDVTLDNSINTMWPLFVIPILASIACMVPIIIVIALMVIVKKSNSNNRIYQNIKTKLSFGKAGNKLPPLNRINYYREVPCNKDLKRAYWLCYQYNIEKVDTLKKGMIGAILLKWIKLGYIEVSPSDNKSFSFKDDNYQIYFKQAPNINNDGILEYNLYNMLISSAGNNKILEANELKNWSRENCSKINEWYSDILSSETSNLRKEGLIKSGKNKTHIRFKIQEEIVDSRLKDEAIKIQGFKKFLLDFSMMPEKEYIEVHLWQDYLIFATLLGISDNVEEQFSKLYPDFKDNINNMVIANMISSTCYRSFSEELGSQIKQMKKQSRQRANNHTHDYSGSSRDTGGGGSSYSNGGSSSSGSSGGGFR